MMGPPQPRLAEALLILLVAALVVSAVRPLAAGPIRTSVGTQLVVLRPDGVNGTDTFILSGTPLWNYGTNAFLQVGPNATTGVLARSLLSFDVGTIPSNATVVNATLSLYETSGVGGSVQARPATASWTEGQGNRSWTRVPVLVRETAGVNRTLEPVGITIGFPMNSVIDPVRDLRVFDGPREIPSEVYGYTYSGGQVTSTQVWFDVTLGARQAKWYNVTYGSNGTAVPAYRTTTWGSSAVWTYGPTGGGATGAAVADLFGDGRLDAIFGSYDGYVYCVSATGGLVWRTQVSPAGQAVPFTPRVADMNRSGQPSVVVVTDDSAVVRLNRAGGIVWRYNSSATLYSTPTLADVNGDGVLDVIVGGNMKFVDALDGRDGTLLRQYPVSLAGYTAAVGNVSGHDVLFFPGDDKKVHAYTFGGTQLWANAAAGASSLEGSISLGDVNGDGVPDVVTGDNGNNGLLFALNATDGSPIWSNATPSYREGGQTLADLNGDGKIEVLFGTRAGTVYALDGRNGNTLWSYPTGTAIYSTPSIADVDGSGALEIVIIAGSSVLVLSPAGQLIHSWTITPNNLNFRSTFEYPMDSPAIADLTGNGTLEALVPTGNGLTAFATGGLFHDWRTWGYDGNHTNLAFDGNSPDRAALLQTNVGLAVSYPAVGASWNYRDGVSAWSARGGDFSAPQANATGVPGWMRWNVTAMVDGWVSGRSANRGLFLTEASEISGPLHLFASGDASTTSFRPVLEIEWTYSSSRIPASAPRIIGVIPDQARPENGPAWTIDLEAHAADNDTPLGQLRWNVTGFDSAVVQVYGLNTPGNHNLTFVPQPDGWGDFVVTYWLTDPAGRYAVQVAWLNVSQVSQPPTFDPPLIFYVHSDQVYRFDFGPYIDDPDTPRDQLALASSDPVGAEVSRFNVSFDYPQALLDRWVLVNLTVSDGSHGVTRAVSIKVTDDQPPFVRSPLPDQNLLQGQVKSGVFNLNDAFATLGGSTLSYAAGPSRTAVTIRPNGSVDLQAPAVWWGVEGLTFRATDPVGAFVEDTILVTVVHVDAPPVLGAVPDLVVHVADPYYFNLEPYLSDPDTPLAGLTVTSSDAHVSISGHLLTALYPIAYNQTMQNVTLSVSDGLLSSSRTIRVTVGTDVPPEALKLPDVRFLEGTVLRTAYDLFASFTSSSGSLQFSSFGNHSILVTIHSNGSVDLAGRSEWWGMERVTFRATDSRGALQEDTVGITVLRVDDAPYFRAVPERHLNTTTSYLPLSAYLGDPDDGLVNLTILGTNSTHATVVGLGLLLAYSRDSTEWVRVTVSDGNLTNTTTILVVVSLPAPAIQEVLPGWILWLPLPGILASTAVFVAYRRRKLEWAFLVTNDGLLVSSISRRGPAEMDTDLVTGMLTTIMDFAKKSFSDEEERNLEGLEMGDKRVAIARGDRAYLAVVYRGRTPGRLLPIMRSLLDKIEKEHRDALGEIVDTSKLAEIPALLERLVSRGNLPFVSFGETASPRP